MSVYMRACAPNRNKCDSNYREQTEKRFRHDFGDRKCSEMDGRLGFRITQATAKPRFNYQAMAR